MDGQANDKALQKFADLMVKKLTEVDADWHKPWFTTTGYGLPQNIDGRVYNGINSFMLFLLQEERSFQTPCIYDFSASKETRASHKQRSIGFSCSILEFYD